MPPKNEITPGQGGSEGVRVPEGPLAGQAALITGASGALGSAIARRFAQEGAGPLVLVSRGLTGDIEAVAQSVRETGATAYVVTGDVSQVADCKRIIAEAAPLCNNGIPILVNAHGITRYRKDGFLAITEDDWDVVMNTNLKGVFFLTQAWFQDRNRHDELKGGRVINLSSVIGEHADAGEGSYPASKGGLNTLTLQFAYEFARWGITVNALAIGFVPETYLTRDMDKEKLALTRAVAPMRRHVTPERVAHAAFMLAHPESDMTSGAVVPVDNLIGGLYNGLGPLRRGGVILGTVNANPEQRTQINRILRGGK